jgi:hypothetical protein
MQLNNLELAVNLAKRANLPGAENLVSSITKMTYVDAVMLVVLFWLHLCLFGCLVSLCCLFLCLVIYFFPVNHSTVPCYTTELCDPIFLKSQGWQVY